MSANLVNGGDVAATWRQRVEDRKRINSREPRHRRADAYQRPLERQNNEQGQSDDLSF